MLLGEGERAATSSLGSRTTAEEHLAVGHALQPPRHKRLVRRLDGDRVRAARGGASQHRRPGHRPGVDVVVAKAAAQGALQDNGTLF